MNEKIEQIGENIILHMVETDKLKTSLVALFVLTDLKKEEITINSLIPAVLRRGTVKHPSIKEISYYMDDMYGAIFDASSDKLGNKQALQFYISTISDEYALNGEPLLNQSIDFMAEMLYLPATENGFFRKDYVEQEKMQLLELIKSRINDKGTFAMNRTLEELFPHDPYGVYKYGREEDIPSITAENLFQQYQKVLQEGIIHVYVVGKFEEEVVKNHVMARFLTTALAGKPHAETKITVDKSDVNEINSIKRVRDVQEVIQGKLVLAYDVNMNVMSEDLYKMYVYNAILGASVTSKLFQNVREKKSMAYTIRSMFLKHKGIMLITAGIEMDKYEKALELIKKEVEDMTIGNFTDEDIENAKTFLKNAYQSYEDDETMFVSFSMGQCLLGMSSNIDETIAQMQKVTKEDIVDIASRICPKVEYYLGNN